MEEKDNTVTNGRDSRCDGYKRFIKFQLDHCKDEEALEFVANYLVQINTESGTVYPGMSFNS